MSLFGLERGEGGVGGRVPGLDLGGNLGGLEFELGQDAILVDHSLAQRKMRRRE
jgi:hypothetical protein